jgi:type II secretory pathway pseudopilin PulG
MTLFQPQPTPSHGRRGISLVEAIVVVGIMTIVLGVVAQVFKANYDTMQRQMARIDADNGAILAIRQLGELARGATGVMPARTINGTAYTGNHDVLILHLPSLDAAGNLVAGQSDYVAVFRNPSDPTQILTDTEIGTGSARPPGQKLLTGSNQTLVFSYNNADPSLANRVSVFLVNARTVRDSTLTSKAWTSIFMRNFSAL